MMDGPVLPSDSCHSCCPSPLNEQGYLAASKLSYCCCCACESTLCLLAIKTQEAEQRFQCRLVNAVRATKQCVKARGAIESMSRGQRILAWISVSGKKQSHVTRSCWRTSEFRIKTQWKAGPLLLWERLHGPCICWSERLHSWLWIPCCSIR